MDRAEPDAGSILTTVRKALSDRWKASWGRNGDNKGKKYLNNQSAFPFQLQCRIADTGFQVINSVVSTASSQNDRRLQQKGMIHCEWNENHQFFGGRNVFDGCKFFVLIQHLFYLKINTSWLNRIYFVWRTSFMQQFGCEACHFLQLINFPVSHICVAASWSPAAPDALWWSMHCGLVMCLSEGYTDFIGQLFSPTINRHVPGRVNPSMVKTSRLPNPQFYILITMYCQLDSLLCWKMPLGFNYRGGNYLCRGRDEAKNLNKIDTGSLEYRRKFLKLLHL